MPNTRDGNGFHTDAYNQQHIDDTHAGKLELSREFQVIPGRRNSSVLATPNLGLSSE